MACVGHRRALHLLHDLRRRARSRPAHTRDAPAAQPTRSLTRPSRALAPVDTRAARALPARGWQVRNQYFYLDDAILAQFPQAASFIVTTFVIVELSSPGTEAISYGVLSSASNVGGPVAIAIGNGLFGMFKPSLSDSSNYVAGRAAAHTRPHTVGRSSPRAVPCTPRTSAPRAFRPPPTTDLVAPWRARARHPWSGGQVEDKPEFRNMVASSVLVGYACSLAAFAFLPLLPAQKDDTQRRLASRPHSMWFAVGAAALLFFGLSYSVLTELLAIFPETACLAIAGGGGCDDDFDLLNGADDTGAAYGNAPSDGAGASADMRFRMR